ncbi:MarR family transcriptional regulator [Streptomyces sp. ME01-24h]|nr:MarR family transcriptional regulator [Streptomyces sp. ME19-03-3]MDX3352747.1 MarR family transcriptional regulator [Streptomyces sp. ME01-24h]
MDAKALGAGDPIEVAAALRLSVGRIARRLRQAHTVGDVTLSEVSVIARLDGDGPDSPGSLAELERVRPQAMATTLAGLEERGLVSRSPDAADRRRVVMTVTEAGRKVLADRRSESVRRLAAVLGGRFTAEERRQLVEALPLLDRLAEEL